MVLDLKYEIGRSKKRDILTQIRRVTFDSAAVFTGRCRVNTGVINNINHMPVRFGRARALLGLLAGCDALSDTGT